MKRNFYKKRGILFVLVLLLSTSGFSKSSESSVYCKIKVQRCAKCLCKWLCREALHGGVAMITCFGLPNLLQLAAWQKNHGCRGSMSSSQ